MIFRYFPVMEISCDILSNLAIFSMETADKSPFDLLMPPQNRNLTPFFKIPHKILENMPH
jgi:hypothetical protein